MEKQSLVKGLLAVVQCTNKYQKQIEITGGGSWMKVESITCGIPYVVSQLNMIYLDS